MLLPLEVRCLDPPKTIPLSTDDALPVSALLTLIQSHIPIPPTKWDLTHLSTRLDPERPLRHYALPPGATLWVQARAHSLEPGVRPLTLVLKEAGRPRTVQMRFTSSTSADACKVQLLAALGQSAGAATTSAVALYRKGEGRRGDVGRGLAAAEEMVGAVEMRGRGTLGEYGVGDGEVLVWRGVASRRERAGRRAREVVERVGSRAKGRMRGRAKESGRGTDGERGVSGAAADESGQVFGPQGDDDSADGGDTADSGGDSYIDELFPHPPASELLYPEETGTLAASGETGESSQQEVSVQVERLGSMNASSD